VNTLLFDEIFVAFCPEFSHDSYVKFQERIISGPFYLNFVKNQGYPLAKFVKFRHTLYNFIRCPYCVEKLQKKITQVLSCIVGTLLRRHVHKKFTKRRYREEKSGHFVFGKSILFTLGLGLTTPYSLGLLV